MRCACKEFGRADGWRVEIVATDLSQEVLEKSRAGMFSQFEVQRGLPIQMLVKYFTQVGETVAAQSEFAPWCSIGSSTCCRIFRILVRST